MVGKFRRNSPVSGAWPFEDHEPDAAVDEPRPVFVAAAQRAVGGAGPSASVIDYDAVGSDAAGYDGGGSDVVIWPRGSDPNMALDEPTTHANEGEVPSHDLFEAPSTVGDGPVVWRPSMTTLRDETTVEAPGWSAPPHAAEDAALPGPVGDVRPSVWLEEVDDRSPDGRNRAIVIGLLVGAAAGLILSSLLSGLLSGV